MTDIFSHEVPAVELVLASPVDERVLAVDQIDQWGAAFTFSVDETGEWHAECLRAQCRNDGRWTDMGASGTHGSEGPLPWALPPDGWMRDPLLVLHSGGLSVDTVTAENQMLHAAIGFADPSVKGIRVIQGDLRRQIAIRSQVGAFVVMSVGVGPIELQAFDLTESKLGSAYRLVEPEEERRSQRVWTIGRITARASISNTLSGPNRDSGPAV